MKFLKAATLSLAFMLMGSFVVLPSVSAETADITPTLSSEISGSDFAADATGAISEADRVDIAITSDFRTAVVGIVNYILTFLGLIAVGFVIYAGIILVTSAGEEDKLEEAKRIIMYATIGIVIILLSYSIVNVIFGVGNNIT